MKTRRLRHLNAEILAVLFLAIFLYASTGFSAEQGKSADGTVISPMKEKKTDSKKGEVNLQPKIKLPEPDKDKGRDKDKDKDKDKKTGSSKGEPVPRIVPPNDKIEPVVPRPGGVPSYAIPPVPSQQIPD